MEKRLPQPLAAEIVDAAGRLACVHLVAYLGGTSWRGLDTDGQELVVDAEQILTLSVGHREAARH